MDVVVGGGPIQGCEPIKYLKARHKDFVVVDKDPNCPAIKQHNLTNSSKPSGKGGSFITGDVATALALLEELKPEYVFPSSPIHIVSELAKIKFKLKIWDEAISPIIPYLPASVVFRSGRGELVLTFNRDKDCIKKCEAPQTLSSTKSPKPCTIGRPRPCTMDQLMRYACPEGFILFSYTRSPGLGAFKGSEILEFFKWAENKAKFVVGTSCNCHGVFWGFQKAGAP